MREENVLRFTFFLFFFKLINREGGGGELFPGVREENVVRFACLVINYSHPLILQNVFIILLGKVLRTIMIQYDVQ